MQYDNHSVLTVKKIKLLILTNVLCSLFLGSNTGMMSVNCSSISECLLMSVASMHLKGINYISSTCTLVIFIHH